MHPDQFEKLCKEILDLSAGTLMRKTKEYATDTDVLANFYQPTSMMGISPAEVCMMYQMKHICSVSKIAKESSSGVLPSKEILQEKCQDMINYTILFYAIMSKLIDEQE